MPTDSSSLAHGPLTLPQRVSIDASVRANVPLCREHFQIDLLTPSFPATEPGEFVQLDCRSAFDESSTEHDWNDIEQAGTWPTVSDPGLLDRTAMLRRPFSLAGRSDTPDGVVLSVIYRVVGVATDWLAGKRIGDRVGVIGPLGNRFPKPANGSGIFVGGGVGIPPMLYLASRWMSVKSPTVQLLAFCGSTTRDLLPLRIIRHESGGPAEPALVVEEFARCGIKSVVTTDDGSFGFRGLVTAALAEYLERLFHVEPNAPRPTLYTCGPEGMMKGVSAIAERFNLPCYVAVERAMACGMATCQSCVIRVRHGTDWRYALSCTEGPIFDARQLLW